MDLKVAVKNDAYVLILLMVFAVLFLTPSKAAASVSVSYQLSPNILMPGDFADGELKIYNPNAVDVEINSIMFYGNGVIITPRSIYNVGTLPPGSSYTLPFSVKALKVGRYDIEAIVSTKDGDVVQHIEVVVDDNFPSVTVSSPLYRNEVNVLKFYISSPVPLTNVRVMPLFDAKPHVVYVGNVEGGGEGEVQFLPVNETNLKFKLSFYIGRNYHEVVKTVPISLLDSQGVALNISSFASTFIGDCIDINLEISNLRHDSIYRVAVKTLSEKGEIDSSVSIPEMKSGESKKVRLLYTPLRGGVDDVRICVEYRNAFGDYNESCRSIEINVSDQYVISVTNLDVKTDLEGTHVSGDVSNNGRGEVLNAYVAAISGNERVDYFLGNIEPSDFQSFDLTLKSNGTIKLIVKWMNKAGKEFVMKKEISKEKYVEKMPEKASSPTLAISIAAAIAVIAIVAVVVYRYVRKP